MTDFEYRCQNDSDLSCAERCESLQACSECECAVLSLEAGGEWGQFFDVVFCILPIAFLIGVTIKPNPMPTTLSLPLSAFLMFLVRLMYLGSDPLLVCASAILGLFEALTPLSIMAGAITLFESMEATYCLPYMMREMKVLTAGHPIAELMLIFCFAYMVEGASGFGTPVALGAPMLVSTGHPAFESVVVLLIMNTFATVWGAVGTPIWFGLGSLDLTDDEFLSVSKKAAVALALGGYILIPMVLRILVPGKVVQENLIFIFASLTTVIGPSVGISFVSYEFPSLIGGIIGCGGTALLIAYKIGLKDVLSDELNRDALDIGSVSENSIVRRYQKTTSSLSNLSTENDQTNHMEATKDPHADETSNGRPNETDNSYMHGSDEHPRGFRTMPSLRETVDDHLGPRKPNGIDYLSEMVSRTFPIWAVVLLLVITRVEQIGVKENLTNREPYFSIHLKTFGTFRLSSSLVFQLRNILTYPSLNWKYELLYVPFLLPFVTVSALTLFFYRKDLAHTPGDIFSTVTSRLKNPAIALLGALVLVQLMIQTEAEAPANILGNVLADWFKQGFIVISPLLGSLGSFFSGSTTVSNLTFGEIQKIAADSIGTSKTTMLALQAVGASAGNGICLNNIIAACAVVGLEVGEGKILAKTFKFVFANTTIATIAMLTLFFRF